MKGLTRLHQVMLTGAFVGALTFLLLYGTDLLNVTNVEWLYAKADLTQHYNGWQFYRNSVWTFPVGLMNTATYPNYFSVIYTDSIPLFAIFFKLLSPILPETFQYFGLWGLLCYILQGMIAACILNRYIGNIIILAVSVVFFTLSPWMFQRLYMHSSLAAHWIILLCILLSSNSEKLKLKKYIMYWSGLFALASTIHIYFIPICVVFLGCTTLYRMWTARKQAEEVLLNVISMFIPIVVSAIILWLLGAFYGTVQFSKGGLGEASANLNFLFNTLGKSNFFPALPSPFTKWPEEGFGYFGIGAFILLGISSIVALGDKDSVQKYQNNKLKIVFVLLLLFIFICLSTAPVVAWSNHIIFKWYLPGGVYWLLDVFRALGRFVWSVCYILLLLAVIGINNKNMQWVKKIGEVGTIAVLTGCLLLQIFEFKTMFKDWVMQVKTVTGYESLEETVWDSFIENYKHIYSFDLESWYDISTYAGSRKLTINQTYLARMNDQFLLRQLYGTLAELQQGKVDADTLYILPEQWGEDEWETMPRLHIYRVDDFYIGTLTPIENMEKYKIVY